jgi:WD40 repeat protein
MTTARYGHTATRLADGRVLIAGGGLNETDATIQDTYASSEIYDPASGTFKATGSMHTARGDHTATLLSDGRVLIAGGSNDSGNVAQAEIYDPSTGKFSVTGTMRTARSGATAVLLHDGRVLIAGGFLGGTPPTSLTSAELYDPATGEFSPAGSMSPGMDSTGTLLPDGRVLIAGGRDNSGSGIASAELYDPATGKLSPTGSMSSGRMGATATILPDGRVLIAGGSNDTSGYLAFLTSAELYDPKTGTFAETGSMHIGCAGPVATALSDGRVLIVGGYDGTSFLTSAELYDPKTGTFAETGSMSIVQRQATAILLSDGRVLIAGGFDAQQDALATAELFEP